MSKPSAQKNRKSHAADPTPSAGIGTGRVVMVSLVLVLAAFAVYWPVAKHEFVIIDDPDFVYANAQVLNGLTWPGIRWAFQLGHGDYWHPVTWLSLMSDATLFGTAPRGFHLMNVALHAANGVLLFQLLRGWTGAFWRSATVAALFLLHPLRVESVAWVTERKDVLSALFFLLTLWAYGRYVRGEGRGERGEVGRAKGEVGSAKGEVGSGKCEVGRAKGEVGSAKDGVSGFYWLALFFFACGLMSKVMVITLPFVLLLLDKWPLGRCEVKRAKGGGQLTSESPATNHPSAKAQSATADQPSTINQLLLEKVPFFVLSVLSYVMASQSQQPKELAFTMTDLSWWVRLETIFVTYASYIAKTFWPVNLGVYYPHPWHWPAPQAALSAALVLIGCVAAWRWRSTRPYVLVGWLWFLGMLVPVLGLTGGWFQYLADRFTYLPLIGLFILLVWGAADVAAGLVKPRTKESGGRRNGFLALLTLPLVVALLVACGWQTRRQLRHWQNSEALLHHTLAVAGGSYLVYEKLSEYLLSQGRVAEAVENYREVLNADFAGPDSGGRKSRVYYQAMAHLNLGAILTLSGRFDEAAEEYRLTLLIDPGNAKAYNNLGQVFARRDRFDEAITNYQAALRLDPRLVEAMDNLGCAYANQGKLDDASASFREALRNNPGYMDSWLNLGRAQALKGNRDEAIAAFRAALRLQPFNSEAKEQLRRLGVPNP